MLTTVGIAIGAIVVGIFIGVLIAKAAVGKDTYESMDPEW